MEALFIFLAFCFGTIIGSFLNVVILRLPDNKTLTGRSHCPACGKTLTALELIPIFSFFIQRGRCRGCRIKISPRYWIVEIFTGLLFAASVYFVQPTGMLLAFTLLKYWLVLAALVVVFVVDLEHFLILDSVIFPVMAVVGFLNVVLDFISKTEILSLNGNFVSGLLGALTLWGMFFLIWFLSSGKWLGFGDVKLAILLGLTLGWPLTFVGLMLAVLIGGVISVFLLVFAGKNLKTQIPFGTFLSLGTVLALFYGSRLLAWYLAILGF